MSAPKYTIVKINIQTKSRKCQNKENRVILRRVCTVQPFFLMSDSKTAPQITPIVMCKTCTPTNVKKADRNALCCQLCPSLTKLMNSYSSNDTNPMPSSKVTTSKPTASDVRLNRKANIATPQVKLLSNKIPVSSNANEGSSNSASVGPPALFGRSIMYVANKLANKIMSVIRYSQNPSSVFSY